MQIPKRLLPLVQDGLIDEVISQLMSGKEASVYVVRCGDEIRCAKVYKEAQKRSFKQAALYQEGRKLRNSRHARAIEKGSKFGRSEQEEIWQTAEVDALYRLAAADVRVPEPYGCTDGVLLMELVTDADGRVAPRLNDIKLSEAQAIRDHAIVMRYVTRMLCAGLVHGDLSEFNVLVDAEGPVIIDLPQAVNAAGNNNARKMLERDINNITHYYARYVPELAETRYAREIWTLYESGELHPDSELTGLFADSEVAADVGDLMEVIDAAREEEEERQRRLQDNQGTE